MANLIYRMYVSQAQVFFFDIVLGLIMPDRLRLEFEQLINQFEQLIKGHTRITDNTATLLDLAFTNKPENIFGAEIEHVGISDHSLIYIQRKISISRKQPKIIITRKYKNYKVDAFKYDLSRVLETL
jgi:hypothetical protein